MDAYALATVSEAGGRPFTAIVRDERVVPLASFGPQVADAPLLDLLDRWDELLPRIGASASAADRFASAAPIEKYRFHAPYRPRQVYCTGANYKRHVLGLMRDQSMHNPADAGLSDAEREEKLVRQLDERAAKGVPYCFVKLPSCVVGPEDDVVLPRNVLKPDWELELGVVIGRRARHVDDAEAMEHVAGYAIVNDVTARDLVFPKSGGMGADWLSGKCFPTFLPFGPYLVPREVAGDPMALDIRLAVNGKVYQDESTTDMMIGIARQIAYLSSRVVLEPGDLICTGSPYGNGSAFGVFLTPGDLMTGTITGLGTQRNRCVAEEAA